MRQRFKSRGQGVIEYAGALVIAAVLVGTVLLTGPEQMGELFDNILATAGEAISSHLPGGGGDIS